MSKRRVSARLRSFQNHQLNNPTPSVQKAYGVLREMSKHKPRFKIVREYAFPPYLVDFYLPVPRIAIEIDGGIHEKKLAYDLRRDSFISKEHGVMMLRFANHEVGSDDFIKFISAAIKQRMKQRSEFFHIRKCLVLGKPLPEGSPTNFHDLHRYAWGTERKCWEKVVPSCHPKKTKRGEFELRIIGY